MKKSILNRYATTESGAFVLDIAAARVADLYENIDNVASFLKKDLDPRLAEFLKDGAEDLAAHPFVIHISLQEAPSPELRTRVSDSIANFFTYMVEIEQRNMRRMAQTSLILFCAGICFLVLATYLNDWVTHSENVLARVFPQGITVAGWVSLWHAIATFLVDWAPRRKDIQIYRRLAGAPVLFPNNEP